jgi:DNA-binding NtrC family response regulator
MPELDGIQASRDTHPEGRREGGGHIGTRDNLDGGEAVKMGAYDFLEKPLSIDKVLEVVSRSIGRGPDARPVVFGFPAGGEPGLTREKRRP